MLGSCALFAVIPSAAKVFENPDVWTRTPFWWWGRARPPCLFFALPLNLDERVETWDRWLLRTRPAVKQGLRRGWERDGSENTANQDVDLPGSKALTLSPVLAGTGGLADNRPASRTDRGVRHLVGTATDTPPEPSPPYNRGLAVKGSWSLGARP